MSTMPERSQPESPQAERTAVSGALPGEAAPDGARPGEARPEGPAEEAGGSTLSAVLWVDPRDQVTIERPPIRPDMMFLRPTMYLPGGLRVCVDHSAGDTEAAAWWNRLAVEAIYASMWHDARARAGRARAT